MYTEDCPEFKDWVNGFLELNGMHRFKDDPHSGQFLLQSRVGLLTREDIDMSNERCVNHVNTVLPDDIKYASSGRGTGILSMLFSLRSDAGSCTRREAAALMRL